MSNERYVTNRLKKCEVGLKLFSTNIESIKIAREYYEKGCFDYLELMALPTTYEKTINFWKSLKVPYVIHGPHSTYGFNFSDIKRRQHNRRIFYETKRFADTLNANYIIMHPGLMGKIEESIHQMCGLKENRLLIENKPFISLRQTRCIGSSQDEIETIIKHTGAGFCLDIAHAVKSSYSNGEDYLRFIKHFLKLSPKIIHLCDCSEKGCFDEHLDLGAGELNLSKLLKMILDCTPKPCFTLEVPEKSYKELKGFKKNYLFINKYLDKLNKIKK